MAIWIVQFVGQKILVLDYIEGVGQVLAYYVNELRSRGWDKALCILPHDGVNENNITGKRYEDHLARRRVSVEVIKNQGKGAAMMRIEAARRCSRASGSTRRNIDRAGARRARLLPRAQGRGLRNVGLGPSLNTTGRATAPTPSA
jgi:phage terminase large subunit